MNCPACGYKMADTDLDCPRCIKYGTQKEGQWPPSPSPSSPIETNLSAQSIEAERVSTEIRGHLNFAKWMILAGFFCMPILFLPIAIYHGSQANAKGQKGQGNTTIGIACLAFILDVMLYYVLKSMQII